MTVSVPDPPATTGASGTPARDPARDALVARWLRMAEQDLHAARLATRDPGFVARIPCYHAQQAAEKAVKAALTALGRRIAWAHDLDALALGLPPAWAVRQTNLPRGVLTQWATETRYPGSLPDPTVGDAGSAVATAQRVLDLIVGDLRANGLWPPPAP